MEKIFRKIGCWLFCFVPLVNICSTLAVSVMSQLKLKILFKKYVPVGNAHQNQNQAN
jgi:hypothetical protein